MNILDENVLASQRQLLQVWHLRVRQIGVDIGSEVHFARAIDFRGFEFSKRAFSFDNTKGGFEAFDKWATDLMNNNNKTHAFVGMEPTGHYWYGFGCHLQNMGVEYGMVNPYHVKRSKLF